MVLSEKGWIRAAKGHDIDRKDSVTNPVTVIWWPSGRSNQQVYLLDSSGRSYALAAHSLPRRVPRASR